MNSRLLTILALVAIVILLASGQQAFAQTKAPHHLNHFTMVHRNHSNAAQADPATSTTTPPGLYPLMAIFSISPAVADPVEPTNSDGFDIWPCFGDGSGTGDCPYIGDPRQNFPSGGMIIGIPVFTWYANSNASLGIVGCGDQTSVFSFCLQANNWYEDATLDTTDDLLWRMVVTQGWNIVFDSGTQDYGPDIFGQTAADYPFTSGFYADANLGNLGQTGRNNGNCFPNSTPTNAPSLFGAAYYPLASPAFAPPYYGVSANNTCGPLIAGMPALVTITVSLATPRYTQHTNTYTCTAADGTLIGPPCYTVKYDKVWSETQRFAVWIK
jgi:hypothetical protein